MKTSIYYQRNLPHYQPFDATYHITIRLAGSLPIDVVQRLRRDNEAFKRSLAGKSLTRQHIQEYRERQLRYSLRIDEILNSGNTGPTWLGEPSVADMVAEAIHYRDNRDFSLLAFCIMPNHVHIVFSIGEEARAFADNRLAAVLVPEGRSFPVTRILSSLKKYTARSANKILGRVGNFWQHESYDHVIRDSGELKQTLRYVVSNPVAAGLISDWMNWRWTYCNPGLPLLE